MKLIRPGAESASTTDIDALAELRHVDSPTTKPAIGIPALLKQFPTGA